MRLIQCHIDNFGTLRDTSVEFSPDLFVCAQPNGWGKSTLAAFLRVMFFGFEGEGRRKGMENERRRYEPWQGGPYGGQVTFEVGGRTYTVTRRFAAKPAGDIFELRDAATNLVSTDFSECLGEELFGINGLSFARTAFVGQNDCATRATDSINAKIGNITDNMNDLDCYEKASAALQDALNKLSPTRKTGRAYQAREEVTRLQTQTRRAEQLATSVRECADAEARARTQWQDLRRQREELRTLAAAAAEVEHAEDEMRRCALSEEQRDQMRRLEEPEEQAEPETRHPARRGLVLWIIGFAAATAGLLAYFLAGRMAPYLAVTVGGAVLLAVGIVLQQVDIGRAERETEQMKEMQTQLMEERAAARTLLTERQADERAARKRYEAARAALAERVESENLPTRAQLEERDRRLEAEAEEARTQAEAYARQLDNLRAACDECAEDAALLPEREAQLARLIRRHDEIQLAGECLSAAKEALTARYMDPLMKSFSACYAVIADAPADGYRMDANANVTLEAYGLQRETESLSRGWQDITGLCLRLAFIDAMYPDEAPFLILDDPLTNFDDAHREAARRLLRMLSGRYQIIYFTCRDVS